jgi:NAD(P)-dependent dehydrogenase (short-subunit alcohol dehydrogenase family)
VYRLVTGAIGEILPHVPVAHCTALIDHKSGGSGYLALLIPDFVPSNHFAGRICQQGERKYQLLDHGAILTDPIHRDSVDLRVCCSERFKVPGVADQLPVAVRSPVTAVEDQYRGPPRRRKCNLALVFVGKAEVGCVLAGVDRHLSPWFAVRGTDRAHISDPQAKIGWILKAEGASMKRNAIVTGANRGIGFEVCRQLQKGGFTTILTARDPERGARAARGLGIDFQELDVTNDDSVTEGVATIADRYGSIDVLVNNAAIHYDTWQRGAAADLEIVHEALETNLLGAWRTCLEVIPLMRRQKWGRIVNVSSQAGSLESMGGGTPAYSVSKAALNAMTRVIAAEVRQDGILVNAVCPGWIATDMGGPGGQPVSRGASSVMWAVELDDDGPSGGFFRHGKRLPW